MRDRPVVLVAALFACFVGVALAQVPVPEKGSDAEQETLESYLKLVRGDLEARRDSALQGLLHLSATEAKAFAPLKQGYDQELRGIGNRRLAAIDDYVKVSSKLTPEDARRLGEVFHQLDVDRLNLRKKYFDRVSKDVSPVAAVQFMQIERQFETMGDLKLATRMPIAVR